MDKKERFKERLHVALVDRYGCIPKPRTLNFDLVSKFKDMDVLSDEAVRKWLVGKSIPSGNALVYLSKHLDKDISYWS